MGGPDDGNLITATTTIVHFISTNWSWVDGFDTQPTTTDLIKGTYVWNPKRGVFEWQKA